MARPRLLLLLLLLVVQVTIATNMTPCNPGKCLSDDLCCQCCPAGHFATKPCHENHSIAKCAPCEPGTFMAHPNLERACFLCSQCREDQEVVSNCSFTADRQCQCRKGYYCDSENCVEHCFQCSRQLPCCTLTGSVWARLPNCSEGRAVLEPCHPRANTICAKMNQEPANSNWYSVVYFVVVLIIVIIIAVVIVIVVIVVIYCYSRTAATPGSELETSITNSSATRISGWSTVMAASTIRETGGPEGGGAL
ncbi:PREDICTED: tumor necrosis factor receptor superfamily member 26-like [Chinchilla lanigera]|uniref:tumor necrosis factor receptor superfamily member 26-like n=1 Tax=Chinchilla lanigera TaxID=34839 RepID=UPI0006989560|nr:PREDICTED: tumor necrosis factor receptor superfamily member 26-like [Chinchilla lanigera]